MHAQKISGPRYPKILRHSRNLRRKTVLMRLGTLPFIIIETILMVGSKIFARNKVQDRFGLYLNHRHFLLQQGERLVEYGNVQTPMQLSSASPDMMARVVPKTWGFFDGSLVPFEFKFASSAEALRPTFAPSQFLSDLQSYLDTNGLASRFGILSRVDHHDFDPQGYFEMTVGRVSMMVPNEDFPDKDITHVAWFFDENGAKIAKDCYRCEGHF
jgi:hypothetical protein